MVYMPAHLSLRRFCEGIWEHYFPVGGMPPPNSQDFAGWVEGRTLLDTLTQVNVATGQQQRGQPLHPGATGVRLGRSGAAERVTQEEFPGGIRPGGRGSAHARDVG